MLKLNDMTTRGRALLVAAAILSVGIVAAVMLPIAAGAQESPDSRSDRPELTPAVCAERAANERPRMESFIDDLVADGVIDQAQADEIESRLRQEHEDHCLTRMLWSPMQAVQATAELTDTATEDVIVALKDGGTLSGYANSYGVDDQALVDAILAPSIVEADALVLAGDLSQEKADQLISDLTMKINDGIHQEHPGKHGPKRFRGPANTVTDDAAEALFS